MRVDALAWSMRRIRPFPGQVGERADVTVVPRDEVFVASGRGMVLPFGWVSLERGGRRRGIAPRSPARSG